MSRNFPTRRRKLALLLEKYDQERHQLATQLSQVGYIWHGSVTRRWQKCGQSSCRCHRDADGRHGPYAYWTTKVSGKTVSRLLKAAEADLYEAWIQNRQQIERIVAALKRLSEKVAPVVLEAETADPDEEGARGERSSRRPISR